MKKLFIVFLLMASALSITSCGSAGETQTPEEGEEQVQIGNPLRESDKKEIQKLTGASFNMPSKFDNISYYVIENLGLHSIGQAGFEYNDAYYTFRVMKSTLLDDISGMYYNWTETKECEIEGLSGEMRSFESESECACTILLFDSENEILYSLSSSDRQAFQDIEKCFEIILKQ